MHIQVFIVDKTLLNEAIQPVQLVEVDWQVWQFDEQVKVDTIHIKAAGVGYIYPDLHKQLVNSKILLDNILQDWQVLAVDIQLKQLKWHD